MSIEATISDPLTPGAAIVLQGDRVTLQAPSDVWLGLATSDILSFDKSGADLLLRLADGSSYQVTDFFQLGPQGTYSRLLTTSDELLVTGLMAPEPDYADTEVATVASGAVEAAEAGTHRAEEPGGLGGFADGALGHLAGAGLMVGSGVVFFSENDQDDNSPPVQTAAPEVGEAEDTVDSEGADEAVTDLLSEAPDDALDALISDETGLETDAQAAEEPQTGEMSAGPLAAGFIVETNSGTSLSDAQLSAATRDLLSDLEVETAAW